MNDRELKVWKKLHELISASKDVGLLVGSYESVADDDDSKCRCAVGACLRQDGFGPDFEKMNMTHIEHKFAEKHWPGEQMAGVVFDVFDLVYVENDRYAGGRDLDRADRADRLRHMREFIARKAGVSQ